MEKRNTLLLTVIAVATLLVAVVGATFAYFANAANTNNVANLNAVTAGSNSEFVTTSAAIAMNVTAANMVQALGNATGNLAATSVTTGDKFKVSFTAGTTEPLTCSYNVYYEWINGTTPGNMYTKTSGITGNEFTYEITMKEDNGTAASWQAPTQFANSYSGTKAEPTTLAKQLIKAQNITNSSPDTPTVQEYDITTKFYNFNVDQTDNSGKNWLIKFYVDDVVC